MRPALLFALKAVIGAGLLWFVIARIPLGEALTAAMTLDPGAIALAVLLYFLAHAVNAVKLQVFLPDLSLWQSWRFTMIGVLYGVALPGQLAGDAVKAVRLARMQKGGDISAILAAVAVDKIVGIFALLVLVALAIGIDATTFDQPVIAATVLALGGAIAILAGAILLPVPAWLGRFGPSLAAWRRASMQPGRLSYALLLGLMFQALCVAITALVGMRLGIDLPIAGWTVVVGFSSIVLLVPISIAGIGVREASLVGAIGYLGGPEAGAFALSLVLLGLTVIGAVAGLIIDLAGRDRLN
ncbi:MAG: flippase-like domain-containing protein [Proteobacteria bacterium]|nr:flippase-like domain-containing protein [Pseudomonadota bacterium]